MSSSLPSVSGAGTSFTARDAAIGDELRAPVHDFGDGGQLRLTARPSDRLLAGIEPRREGPPPGASR